MPRTRKCLHPPNEGCYHCCELCNMDEHKCKGCGEQIEHGSVACAECESEIKRRGQNVRSLG